MTVAHGSLGLPASAQDRAVAAIDRLTATPSLPPPVDGPRPTAGDRRSGTVYLLDDELAFAVKVALVTGRPLLLTGTPGTGKSSLAGYLANGLGWRYYEHVVTARTEASDLLWQFDAVQKLSDASTTSVRSRQLRNANYVEPGVLWWAMDPVSARARGGSGRPAVEPFSSLNATRSSEHAVVLIDEIDKADPDVPNALLVPLGSFEFDVRETRTRIVLEDGADESHQRSVLVVITSNGERDLPAAFVRRCVVHEIEAPTARRLVKIALVHAEADGRAIDPPTLERITELANRVAPATDEDSAPVAAPSPAGGGAGTAEFLDAVRAALELGMGPKDPKWDLLLSLTVRKPTART